MAMTKESNTTQEVHVVEKELHKAWIMIQKSDNNVNGYNVNTNVNSLTNYFTFFTKCRSRQKEKHQTDVKSAQCFWQCV